MRILVFGREFLESFTRKIIVALRDMGHDVTPALRMDRLGDAQRAESLS